MMGEQQEWQEGHRLHSLGAVEIQQTQMDTLS
jgi:hypothetical protein